MAGTIKEVCTTLMLLYLTKTEREERGKIILVPRGAGIFAKFVFLHSAHNGDSLKKCLLERVRQKE